MPHFHIYYKEVQLATYLYNQIAAAVRSEARAILLDYLNPSVLA